MWADGFRLGYAGDRQRSVFVISKSEKCQQACASGSGEQREPEYRRCGIFILALVRVDSQFGMARTEAASIRQDLQIKVVNTFLAIEATHIGIYKPLVPARNHLSVAVQIPTCLEQVVGDALRVNRNVFVSA